jgi:predicted signal transduction protein with EAL and GGDEF domain
VKVAIDDFGTGFSSLAYLHTLPVTMVKVDRSFVERLDSADDSTPVVKAIIDMSHAMGLQVVAEGVSSARLRTLVSDLGCEQPKASIGLSRCRLRSSRTGGETPSACLASSSSRVSGRM